MHTPSEDLKRVRRQVSRAHLELDRIGIPRVDTVLNIPLPLETRIERLGRVADHLRGQLLTQIATDLVPR